MNACRNKGLCEQRCTAKVTLEAIRGTLLEPEVHLKQMSRLETVAHTCPSANGWVATRVAMSALLGLPGWISVFDASEIQLLGRALDISGCKGQWTTGESLLYLSRVCFNLRLSYSRLKDRATNETGRQLNTP